MHFLKAISTIALVLAPVLALPSEVLKGELSADSNPLAIRQSCAATCGSVCYGQTAIDDAVSEGYNLYSTGSTAGRNKYPHQYYDRDGFSFLVGGPYEEFPIMKNGNVYTGGAPGPDRVVFNTNGEFAGTITHTGAGGNNFLQCY